LKVALVDKLLDEVLLMMVRIVNDLHQLDDEGVPHLLHDRHLLLDEGELALLRSQHLLLHFLLVYDLHRVLLFRLNIDNLFDLGEVALAELADDEVLVDLLFASFLLGLN